MFKFCIFILGFSYLTPVFANETILQKEQITERVNGLFKKHCLNCHGASDPDGDFNLESRDEMIELKSVDFVNPKESILYKVLESGKMPRKSDYIFDSKELNIVEEWISHGAPELEIQKKINNSVSKNRQSTAEEIEKNTEYQVLRIVSEDSSKLPKNELHHYRYFSSRHLYERGFSEEQLKMFHQALIKTLNSLHWENHVVIPTEIDELKTIYRIDLRELDWDLQKWNEITKSYPYFIQFTSQQALDLYYNLVDNTQPILRTDWFVQSTLIDPLYSKILELPNTLQELESMLHIDSKQNIENGDTIRAGFLKSGISVNNRIIERHQIPNGGAYWKSYDFKGVSGESDIFSRPLAPGEGRSLGFKHDGGEFIFNLPNGFQAYYLSDASGKQLFKAPTEIVRDTSQRDSAVTNAISCMSCHVRGVREKYDEIYLEIPNFPVADHKILKSLYGRNDELKNFFKEDRNRFENALAKAGILEKYKVETTKSISQSYESNVNVQTAAAELGITESYLEELLTSHGFSFLWRQLKLGLDRRIFEEKFGEISKILALNDLKTITNSQIKKNKKLK